MQTAPAARDTYRHEMNDKDHVRLLDAIMDVREKVVVSGHRAALYDYFLHTWVRREIDIPKHSGHAKHKRRRVEVLWLNPGCACLG
jgi:DNA adenine methylase